MAIMSILNIRLKVDKFGCWKMKTGFFEYIFLVQACDGMKLYVGPGKGGFVYWPGSECM